MKFIGFLYLFFGLYGGFASYRALIHKEHIGITLVWHIEENKVTQINGAN